MADPLDILFWPDGFWCFRNELPPEFRRGGNHRVIPWNSFEWASRARAARPLAAE